MSFSSTIGIIGGSGFYSLTDDAAAVERVEEAVTPYSDDPVTLYQEEYEGTKLWFIPRHGKDHSVPPHKINYRANLWALKDVGVKNIIAVNAVGGLTEKMAPGQIVIPDQIIDYSWGREHTYFDGLSDLDNHIDFTWPYTAALSQILNQSAVELEISTLTKAVYACTQGPRLETAAEVRKLINDACDIVGMTGMPEAALARELQLNYASIALVVNWGAGITDEEITMDDIRGVFDSGLKEVRKIIQASLKRL